jgi:hypothetical protein
MPRRLYRDAVQRDPRPRLGSDTTGQPISSASRVVPSPPKYRGSSAKAAYLRKGTKHLNGCEGE